MRNLIFYILLLGLLIMATPTHRTHAEEDLIGALIHKEIKQESAPKPSPPVIQQAAHPNPPQQQEATPVIKPQKQWTIVALNHSEPISPMEAPLDQAPPSSLIPPQILVGEPPFPLLT